eukprot:scaffold1671_cov344-Pavlova_lutheri.AAC.35
MHVPRRGPVWRPCIPALQTPHRYTPFCRHTPPGSTEDRGGRIRRDTPKHEGKTVESGRIQDEYSQRLGRGALGTRSRHAWEFGPSIDPFRVDVRNPSQAMNTKVVQRDGRAPMVTSVPYRLLVTLDLAWQQDTRHADRFPIYGMHRTHDGTTMQEVSAAFPLDGYFGGAHHPQPLQQFAQKVDRRHGLNKKSRRNRLALWRTLRSGIRHHDATRCPTPSCSLNHVLSHALDHFGSKSGNAEERPSLILAHKFVKGDASFVNCPLERIQGTWQRTCTVGKDIDTVDNLFARRDNSGSTNTARLSLFFAGLEAPPTSMLEEPLVSPFPPKSLFLCHVDRNLVMDDVQRSYPSELTFYCVGSIRSNPNVERGWVRVNGGNSSSRARNGRGAARLARTWRGLSMHDGQVDAGEAEQEGRGESSGGESYPREGGRRGKRAEWSALGGIGGLRRLGRAQLHSAIGRGDAEDALAIG